MTAHSSADVEDAPLGQVLARARVPVLVVSTKVGRGMYSLGEAIVERMPAGTAVEHIDIESLLPPSGLREDLERYRAISNHWPWLLNLVYRVPVFYYRKYLWERVIPADLSALRKKIDRMRPRTVICVSHRPAFWTSALKHRCGLDFELWGVLGELGDTLGWRYLFWNAIDRFLSPVSASGLSSRMPNRVAFTPITLPARRAYEELRAVLPDPRRMLLVCGYWGQGPIVRVAHEILSAMPEARIDIVCGENSEIRRLASAAFGRDDRVAIHGCVPSLVPLVRECAAVVTKPGISTLLEVHAANRKIFLLRGMPVAEDNNARYAVRHFGAEWLSAPALRQWRVHAGIG
jgi:UDP-N-acetylglucosamine:LPS N-acetylglucosamine transferase